MSRMVAASVLAIGIFAVALLGQVQKSEPIPPDMMGTSGTVIGFVRDTACLLRPTGSNVLAISEPWEHLPPVEDSRADRCGLLPGQNALLSAAKRRGRLC